MRRPSSLILLPAILAIVLRPALAAEVRREIHFPDLVGYQTIQCDLHMHTVFSDGQVWPPVRVVEAWRQGLDAISITDHIEYQPHQDDVKTNHNRPYELSREAAKIHGVLLVKGAEITRDTPPGHFNATFLKDIYSLDTEDFLEVIKRANEQGAFVVWNHQEWKGPENGRWLDVHTTMVNNKWLHAMEVANGGTYYPSAHKWCLEKGLTMIGASDIHEPDRREASTVDGHRTMTLVFVKERTLDGLKESLQQGRTIVWYKDQLIGRKEWLEPLFAKCVQVALPHLRSEKNAWVEIRNICDVDIRLERTGNLGPNQMVLPARATTLVKIEMGGTTGPVELKYRAANFVTEPESGLPVVLKINDVLSPTAAPRTIKRYSFGANQTITQ
jgi:hypothetical protein